tara:strand:+ start:942 stop:1286 length:345 start_codon:yes stop_codon:yes gene_type:complete
MRAPNGQGCALSAKSKDMSIAVAGDVMRSSVRYLESAANGQHQIEVRIVTDELEELRRMYLDVKGTQAQLCHLLNDAMKFVKLPYEVSFGEIGDGATFAFLVSHRQVAESVAIT